MEAVLDSVFLRDIISHLDGWDALIGTRVTMTVGGASRRLHVAVHSPPLLAWQHERPGPGAATSSAFARALVKNTATGTCRHDDCDVEHRGTM
jgi:hypothetical protein